jgi:hypothetical protein
MQNGITGNLTFRHCASSWAQHEATNGCRFKRHQVEFILSIGELPMNKLVLVASALLVSTAAFANDPIGPVNMRLVLNPAAPSEETMATHRQYVQNLKAAGLYNNSTNPIGPVNTTVVLSPNHSKVPAGSHWSGETAATRSVSRSDAAGWH